MKSRAMYRYSVYIISAWSWGFHGDWPSVVYIVLKDDSHSASGVVRLYAFPYPGSITDI